MQLQSYFVIPLFAIGLFIISYFGVHPIHPNILTISAVVFSLGVALPGINNITPGERFWLFLVGGLWGCLGTIAYVSGDLVTARMYDEESLRLFLQQGDVPFTSLLLSTLEVIVSSQGDEEMARSLHQQRSLLMQQASQRGTHALFLISSGEIWLHMLKDEIQAKLYTEGLRFWQDLPQVVQGITKGLTGLAEIAAAQRQAERAGRLFGAAARLLPFDSLYRDGLNSRITAARTSLDAATFEAGWSAGQAMTEEQAISFALQDV